MSARYVQEAAKLAPQRSDGSYPVVIITEGEGSTGVYATELMREDQAVLFEGVPSFMDHPIDPEHPERRSVLSIGGRVKDLHVGEDKGKAAILGNYFPRKEYAEFVAEYRDSLALSIYSLVNGQPNADGKIVVESFAGEDPYRSVDVVVAAGRGGRFKQAQESLRAIESSLGAPEGSKPGSASESGEKESMELKDLATAFEALAQRLEPVIAFVTEQKAELEGKVTAAEAKAETVEQEKGSAVESYMIAAKAVSEAKLLPTQEADILAAAAEGEDVKPLIESATKVRDEAFKVGSPAGYVIESASGATDGEGFTFFKGGRR